MKRIKILLQSADKVQEGLVAFFRILVLGFAAGLAVGMFLTGCKLALRILP